MHPGPGVNSTVDGMRDATSLDPALSIEDDMKDLESIAYSSANALRGLGGRPQDHKNGPLEAEGALCKTDPLPTAPEKEDMEVDENRNEVPSHSIRFPETGISRKYFPGGGRIIFRNREEVIRVSSQAKGAADHSPISLQY
ncbi:predicted protein [Postia placenta Mad-698-R]|uniref:Uncharacterized protein n=1 Tax=Postia placenta MAD-698-R-SB12 TaxID=670580 RepID=A0A1X6MKY7_9APHY|nr:hypothetical protein POSPLADRAFT_1159256 [Postia placenta MAD-698-R-SB12]EED83601.1 predicted protein [Postia placenta Mad-698-R]OSX56713.1 hypothetical protein POSPLADRAFT_1159256 [Postia placenta MAD-698-R-SB12]